jgi:hypothetical protein
VAEERAVPSIGGIGQGVWIERSAAHRSVWYSRCRRCALGSIGEI